MHEQSDAPQRAVYNHSNHGLTICLPMSSIDDSQYNLISAGFKNRHDIIAASVEADGMENDHER